jgi:hypothetical protein
MSWSRPALVPHAFATLVALSTAATALAQFPGELVYGPSAGREEAGKRVVPVTACPDGLGGFVTAGTSRPDAGDSDVYVVRTGLDGLRVWEFTYDIGGGGADTGSSIAVLRDGSGFAVTGSTNPAGADQEVLLMKIDCAGKVVWATQFVSPAAKETGYDVIEAATGTPSLGTSPGDLVVAGVTTNAANDTPDGILIRTRADGSLIWNRRYDFRADAQLFRALLEARPTSSPTGDIVAVGEVRLAGGAEPRALSLRVNGDNGLFTGPLHCAAGRGEPGAKARFDAVIELSVAPLAGSLVMAGSVLTSARHSDLYLVRTGSNVCGGGVQRRAGQGAAGALPDEAALDLREVLSPLPIAPVGALVLTGRVGKAASTAYDAFLHTAVPRTLALRRGAGRRFGDHAGKREWGTAVTPFGNGFVIAGLSESDFEGVGDLSDLYLVGTNGAGRTDCALPWNPPQTAVAFATKKFKPAAVSSLQQVFPPVERTEHATEYQRCR